MKRFNVSNVMKFKKDDKEFPDVVYFWGHEPEEPDIAYIRIDFVKEAIRECIDRPKGVQPESACRLLEIK